MEHQDTRLAIVGAGASGLCAAVAASRVFARLGRPPGEILLLEAQPRVGRKLLATGNGRCNLTNRFLRADAYFENGGFAMEVLARANTDAVLDFFRSLGLVTREEGDGRVYPLSNQASSVLDALRFAVEQSGVRVLTDTRADSLTLAENGFLINGTLRARRVILAAGGRSASSFGSDGSGFALLRALGIPVTPAHPALTGLVLSGDYPRALKGVRAHCRVRLLDEAAAVLAEDTGEVQFNETGVSGIPVLQISRFASMHRHTRLCLDRLPGMGAPELFAYLRERAAALPLLAAENLMGGLMPKRLSSVCVKEAGIAPSAAASVLQSADLARLADCVKGKAYGVLRTAGFGQSQVTAGGADTGAFSPETLESKQIKGLYCCGEILNVDGLCGGYNLQWAWGSALLAAQAASGGRE